MTEVKAAISNHLCATENRETPLSETEERFRLVLEASPDGFIILRSIRNAAGEITDFQIEYTNPVAARGVNLTPEELLGQYLLHLFPDCKTNGIFARYVTVAETGISTTFETFYESKELTGWFRNVVVKIKDSIAVSFSDITEQQAALRDRKRAEQRRDVQYVITRILAEAKTITEATPAILQALCENLGWQVGALWKIDSNPPLLRCVNYWQAANVDMRAFIKASQQMSFQEGIGLPGRVWASRQPHWIRELTQDSNFPRTALASSVGLQSGFGFPILLGNEILGVIECFSQHVQEPDEDLLDMMAAIGSQIGQLIERKRTQAALQESQQLFQSFMNHSPIAAFIKDESGRYVYANSWVEQVYGRSQSDLLGKTDFELLPPTIAQQCYTNDLTVLSSGQPMQMLETIQHQDGEHSYMSFKFPFRNAAGQQLIAGVAIDVTEQVRAEEELRKREAELRLITNAVPVLISFVDTQQCYRFNNQKYEEWFGKSATEVYGKHLREVLGEAAYAAIHPYVEKVLAGQEVTFESKVAYKNGGTRFISATYVPRFDQQGKVEGFVALVSDISQRQQAEETIHQSEERLRIAQQAANAGVWNWDISTNQVTWSEEYYYLYGLNRATTPPSYQNWLLSIVEQDRDRVDQAARKALEQHTDLNVEFRILHPNRGERWLTAIGQTFYDRNGKPQRMTGIALDITERKHAELALAKSNQTLEAIIQACPLAIMGLRSDGTVKIWNPAAERIFGWSQKEVLGQFLPAIPQYKRHEFLNNIAATIQGQTLAGVETQRQKKGNLPIDVAIWSASVDEAKVGISCLAIVADITERKQADAALRKSEAFNRQILESSQDCIKVLDLEGSLLYMNPGGQKLLGANDIKPFIGHSWVKFWQKADQPAAQEALKKAKTDGVGTFQGYCPTLAGEPKYWDVQITPIKGADGQIERLLCISRDITAHKQTEAALRQSEEHYRYLAELIPQLVWTANTEGVLIDINQRWSEFTGLTLAQARMGGWQAVVHPDDVSILGQKWAIAQQDSTYYQAEGRMRRADGVYRWHLHQAVPLKNEQGQVIKWFGTATDIEDRKQLEQQRIQLLQQEQAGREQAETANRIKDEFLAVLSHELRSPLNPILGWAKLLQTRKFDEAGTKRALQTIERNAKLQTQLIDDLLDVSRILRGKMVLNVCSVDLVTVIDAALETVRLSAEAKGIEIEKIFIGDIGLICGDSGRLQQIVWNLLSNAVKFTPNSGKITIQLEQVGSYVQIQVRDTGKGITPTFLPYVFEYFRQEDGTTTRKFGGLGLGLAIVRYLTELHGGTVKAESLGEGLGATFTVCLPLPKPENAEKTDEAVSASDVVDASPLANLRILIVDDEADMRELILTILQQTGAEVRVAASAIEALQVLDIFKPDVLISDIGMPDIDGYELMRQVRSLASQNTGVIPAIALTAYAGEFNQQQALAAGFQKHVAKPVSPEELVEAIVTLID